MTALEETDAEWRSDGALRHCSKTDDDKATTTQTHDTTRLVAENHLMNRHVTDLFLTGVNESIVHL